MDSFPPGTQASWLDTSQRIAKALKSFSLERIELLEQDGNLLTIGLVVNEMAEVKQLTRYRMVDETIAKNDPDLYRQYLFAYEVWTSKELADHKRAIGRLSTLT